MAAAQLSPIQTLLPAEPRLCPSPSSPASGTSSAPPYIPPRQPAIMSTAESFDLSASLPNFDYDLSGLQTPPVTALRNVVPRSAGPALDPTESLSDSRRQASREKISSDPDSGGIQRGPSDSLGETEGSSLASGSLNAAARAQLPADPRFPYANLLASGPVNVGPSSLQPPFNDPMAHLEHPSGQGLPALLPTGQHNAQAHSRKVHSGRPHHRSHPYQPTSADIINRHTSNRAPWDDAPSPEQDISSRLLAGSSTADANGGPSFIARPYNSTLSSNNGSAAKSAPSRSGQKRRQKYTRTRTGCLCCRSRRIKCDETRPVCKRCVIAKKDCVYPDCAGGGSATNSARNSPVPEGHRGKGRSSGDDSGDDSDRDRLSGTRPGSPSAYGSFNANPNPQAHNALWFGSGLGGYDGHTTHSNGNLYDGSALNMAHISDGLVGSGMGGGMGLMEMGLSMGLAQQQQMQQTNEHPVEGFSSTDLGKQDWGGEQGGAPMLSTPNFLLPWFPTAEERSLILHYCANAASLMMAIPSGLNPMLAINLPLALDSPRGMNASADALRVALLGIGAIHQAFLLARSGVASPQTAAMFQYASTLRETGKEMVRRAARSGTTDAALGAGTALATIDIFFGGGNWQDNFRCVKEMVRTLGGPAEMLKNSTPTQLTEGVTVSPARLMLEILAIYETFGCLTTGEEPALISDKAENWWLEASRSTYEEHSVEKQFGMSRVMVLLFNRLTRLMNRVAKAGVDVPDATPPNDSNEPFPSFLPPTSGTSSPEEIFAKEASQLNQDVDTWIESLQLSTLEHERVQVGNRAYAHAMKILLLRRVFKHPREDSRVQNAAQQVLQHCSWSTAALGMSIDLTWPAIIAGSCAGGSTRQWVLTLLEGFKSQCCFDIDTATRIITEVWRRVDARESRADWKEVCEDLSLQVLLC